LESWFARVVFPEDSGPVITSISVFITITLVPS
jgi:hypothetical protein